jgi:hypothetical protein
LFILIKGLKKIRILKRNAVWGLGLNREHSLENFCHCKKFWTESIKIFWSRRFVLLGRSVPLSATILFVFKEKTKRISTTIGAKEEYLVLLK